MKCHAVQSLEEKARGSTYVVFVFRSIILYFGINIMYSVAFLN